jgi:hypothetical protein
MFLGSLLVQIKADQLKTGVCQMVLKDNFYPLKVSQK